MKFIDLVSLSLALSQVIRAFPATDADVKQLEPITGTVISTGVTEDGEPYTITADQRELTDADFAMLVEMASHSNSTGLEKRQGVTTGALGNCNQWYNNKYCYCSGEISNRGDCYWGGREICDNIRFKNFRGEFYHVKWLPTVKIEFWAYNVCGHDRYVGDNCADIYFELLNWCEWGWMSHKGGHFNFDSCLQFRYDVNSR